MFFIELCVLRNLKRYKDYKNGDVKLRNWEGVHRGTTEQMEIFLNGEAKACPEGTTIEGLLDLFKIDKRRTCGRIELTHRSEKRVFDSGVKRCRRVGGGNLCWRRIRREIVWKIKT